jgi:hypothetical protein
MFRKTNISTLLKETLPILFPVFIVYCIYDVFRCFQGSSVEGHFPHTLGKFESYSILREGFVPLLSKYLAMKADSWTTQIMNDLFYLSYILLTLVAMGYAFIFHVLCLYSSYERKWKQLHSLAVKSFI